MWDYPLHSIAMFAHRSWIRWVYLFCKLYRLLLGSTRNFRVKVIGRHDGVWPVCLPKRVFKYCNYAEICFFTFTHCQGYLGLYLYIYIHVTRTSVSHLNQSHRPCWATARFVRLAGLAGLARSQMEMKRQSVFRMASGVDDVFFDQ